MKRKASVLDEPEHISDWSRSDSSVTTASPDSARTAYNQWHTPAVPHLSSRTRKRYRDGRPDEQVIHQNTLSKLFDAQRKIYSDEVAEQRRSQQVGSYLMSLDTFEPTIVNQTICQPKQQILDAFFGGSSRNQRQRQPQHFISSFQTSSDSTLRCEDCATQLQPSEMSTDMDVDMNMSEWSCASCWRNVCDTCAVRGDQRICLECAIPGGRVE